ncbi:MAG: molecular chaperone Tir, partial [Chloroflexi bacterium]|nr:molecular chaperone Tir [Chloroflexota bacterium]
NQAALYEAIKEQIRPCHIVLIMAGVYSTYSKWINKEIQISKTDFAKPIVGVKPWAQTNVSSVVSQNADILVGWSSKSIIDAIREYAL